jgi:hypothetical protein
MIVEQRIYSFAPGKMNAYLDLYEKQGMPLAKEKLGTPLGIFYTEVGQLNTVVSLWRYDSFEDRLRRRAQLAQEPSWKKYAEQAVPLVLGQQTSLLLPANFSPIK